MSAENQDMVRDMLRDLHGADEDDNKYVCLIHASVFPLDLLV